MDLKTIGLIFLAVIISIGLALGGVILFIKLLSLFGAGF